MPNSLRSKLSSLRYKRLLTDEEYNELIKKLGGHDREIRAKVIDEFTERLKRESFSGYATLEDYSEDAFESVAVEDICRIAEEMKGEQHG